MNQYYDLISQIHIDVEKIAFDPKELNVLVICSDNAHHSRITKCKRADANRIARHLFSQGMKGVRIIDERDYMKMVQDGRIVLNPYIAYDMFPRNMQESAMFAQMNAIHQTGKMAPPTRAKM